jgi:hypothetical protein
MLIPSLTFLTLGNNFGRFLNPGRRLQTRWQKVKEHKKLNATFVVSAQRGTQSFCRCFTCASDGFVSAYAVMSRPGVADAAHLLALLLFSSTRHVMLFQVICS